MNYRNILFSVLLVFAIGACNKSAEKGNLLLNYDQLIEDLRVLSSDEMEGRKTGTKGNRKAREYLVYRYNEAGADAFMGSYTHDFSFTDRQGNEMAGVNVIGQVHGKSDSVIVISAHYDHIGKRDSLIYNGADDDASGTAALLTYISYFSEHTPNHTLVFAAFDAEEMGLQGARAFTQQIDFMERVKLNINLDMIAQNTENELYAVGTYHYPELKPILKEIDTGEIDLLFGHDEPESELDDWTYASDHAPFHQKGIPFVYFGVEDHEHYHRPTDEFETIPQEFYKHSVQLILHAIHKIDHEL